MLLANLFFKGQSLYLKVLGVESSAAKLPFPFWERVGDGAFDFSASFV